jgi:hypothetical protein
MARYNTSHSAEVRLCCPGTDGFQIAVDFTPPLHQIVIHLQAEKETFRQAEITRQPEVGIGGESRLPSTISLMRRGAT